MMGGLKLEPATYLEVIKACKKTSRWDRVCPVIDDAAKHGVNPGIAGFNLGLEACAELGDYKTALSLLDEMDSMGVNSNDGSFALAMAACELGGQWQWIKSMLKEMDERGVEPDGMSYRLAIRACVVSLGRRGAYPSEPNPQRPPHPCDRPSPIDSHSEPHTTRRRRASGSPRGRCRTRPTRAATTTGRGRPSRRTFWGRGWRGLAPRRRSRTRPRSRPARVVKRRSLRLRRRDFLGRATRAPGSLAAGGRAFNLLPFFVCVSSYALDTHARHRTQAG